MSIVLSILQVIVALGLLNVWLLRFNKGTEFRGGSAANMQQEFAHYGLPAWFMWFVGASKIVIAVCMLAGLYFHALVFPAAAYLCVLMLGALAMHLKVGDPIEKSLPALGMLVFAAALCFVHRG